MGGRDRRNLDWGVDDLCVSCNLLVLHASRDANERGFDLGSVALARPVPVAWLGTRRSYARFLANTGVFVGQRWLRNHWCPCT